MCTTRFLFFAILAGLTISGTCLAQSETKVARDKFSSVVADPSPWEKEEESGLWYLERDAPGEQWKMAMAVVDKTVHFTIMLPCESGESVTFHWKCHDTLARGTSCSGREAVMSVTHLEKWAEPIPLELQKICKPRKGKLASAEKRK